MVFRQILILFNRLFGITKCYYCQGLCNFKMVGGKSARAWGGDLVRYVCKTPSCQPKDSKDTSVIHEFSQDTNTIRRICHVSSWIVRENHIDINSWKESLGLILRVGLGILDY